MDGYIARVVPLSEDYWPHHSSAVFFLAGCNYHCPYCYESSILGFREEYHVPLKPAFEEIEEVLPLIDSVFITGGEPLLQRALCEEISVFAARHGLEVGLDTNGSKPFALKTMLEKGLLNHVNMDVKAPLDAAIFENVTKSRTFFKLTEAIMGDTRRSIELLKEHDEKVDVVFTTVVIPSLMYKKSQFLKIAGLIKGVNAEWHLKPFVPSQEVSSMMMRNLDSPSKEFIQRIKNAVLAEYPNMRIRIVD